MAIDKNGHYYFECPHCYPPFGIEPDDLPNDLPDDDGDIIGG